MESQVYQRRKHHQTGVQTTPIIFNVTILDFTLSNYSGQNPFSTTGPEITLGPQQNALKTRRKHGLRPNTADSRQVRPAPIR